MRRKLVLKHSSLDRLGWLIMIFLGCFLWKLYVSLLLIIIIKFIVNLG